LTHSFSPWYPPFLLGRFFREPLGGDAISCAAFFDSDGGDEGVERDMAAKAWGAQQKAVDEIFFQNDAVSLCLLVNRRARTMRVVDFRAGPTAAKRMFVLSLAKREGVDKAYTLVERDEVATWIKLGFLKEGNIPGFYKRSDAFLLGCLVNGARPAQAAQVTPIASETRIIAAKADPGSKTPEEIAGSAAHDLAERTLVHAKKLAKELVEKSLPVAKVATIRETEVRKPLAAALKSGRALTGFEPFGRDVERRYFSLTARGGFELVASTESQACFGNAFIELLQAPKGEAERLATIAAMRALCERLLAEGVVSTFALSPSDDVPFATAFVANGFRRTGLLQGHLLVRDERKDAIIWSRKLANPADE
jgi:hypothetical protein